MVVAVNPTNRARIDAALLELSARPVGTSERGSKFDTRHGELELLNTTSGVGSYEGWVAGAQRVSVGEGVTVLLAGSADIARNKNAAGREKDELHIELLNARGGRIKAGRAEELLGPRPQEPGAGRRWDAVGAIVDRYCGRYQLELPERLERPPSDPEQLSDWRRVTRIIDQTRDAAHPDLQGLDPESAAARTVARQSGRSPARGGKAAPRTRGRPTHRPLPRPVHARARALGRLAVWFGEEQFELGQPVDLMAQPLPGGHGPINAHEHVGDLRRAVGPRCFIREPTAHAMT